jgi:hypothetical protein
VFDFCDSRILTSGVEVHSRDPDFAEETEFGVPSSADSLLDNMWIFRHPFRTCPHHFLLLRCSIARRSLVVTCFKVLRKRFDNMWMFERLFAHVISTPIFLIHCSHTAQDTFFSRLSFLDLDEDNW